MISGRRHWNKGKDTKKKKDNFTNDATDLDETADCGKKKKQELKTRIDEIRKKIEETEKKIEEFDKEEDLEKLDEAKRLIGKAEKTIVHTGKTKFIIIGGIIAAIIIGVIILVGMSTPTEWNR